MLIAVIIVAAIVGWLACGIGLGCVNAALTHTDIGYNDGGIIFWHLLFWPIILVLDVLIGLVWCANGVAKLILRQKPRGRGWR